MNISWHAFRFSPIAKPVLAVVATQVEGPYDGTRVEAFLAYPDGLASCIKPFAYRKKCSGENEEFLREVAKDWAASTARRAVVADGLDPEKFTSEDDVSTVQVRAWRSLGLYPQLEVAGEMAVADGLREAILKTASIQIEDWDPHKIG